MVDREKVIKGLECCAEAKCEVCPYEEQCFGEEICVCSPMAKDMLELLKAQEVSDTNVGKWTTERTQEHDGEWYCSECGYEPIVMSDDMKYCPGCGRKMTMPEPPKEET